MGFWEPGKCQKHGVSVDEIEGLFERPIMILPDTSHSSTEERLRAIGRTEAGRYVFVIFTIRERGEQRVIRPVSARYMHQKEIDSYEEENPEF